MSKKQHKEQEQKPESTETTELSPDYEKEALDWRDKYLRCMAEFENFRKRSHQEKADWIKLATQKLAVDICDVADNFERAMLQAMPEELESSFGKGISMIEKQLVQTLEKEGIKRMDVLGAAFDPEYHDALAHIPSDYEENTIAAIIQNGYTMHDKVLRPARVAVSSGNNNNNMKSLEE